MKGERARYWLRHMMIVLVIALVLNIGLSFVSTSLSMWVGVIAAFYYSFISFKIMSEQSNRKMTVKRYIKIMNKLLFRGVIADVSSKSGFGQTAEKYRG